MSAPTPYASSVTVPFPAEEDVRQALGEAYKPDMLNVTRMFAGTGDCFPAVVGLVKALFEADDMDDKLREVVTLRAAALMNAPYEWQQNSKMALNVGLTEGDIAAVAAEGPVQGLAPDWLLACAATDELIQDGTLTDKTLSRLLDRYGPDTTRKLILAVGYFTLLAMFLNGCRVPLETIDKIGTSTSPLA